MEMAVRMGGDIGHSASASVLRDGGGWSGRQAWRLRGVAAGGWRPSRAWCRPSKATHWANTSAAHDLDRDRHEAVARAAQFRALAEIDAGAISILNQVSLRRPGTASIFTQKAGTAKLWITSLEVVIRLHHGAGRNDHALVDREQARAVGIGAVALLLGARTSPFSLSMFETISMSPLSGY
jgi:hypothetical protein